MRSLLLFPLLLGFSVPAFAHNVGGSGVDAPNGWSQVGKYCQKNPHLYYKLQKNSNKSVYGVYREDDDEGFASYKWTLKDVTLQEANQQMNLSCDTNSYQPT